MNPPDDSPSGQAPTGKPAGGSALDWAQRAGATGDVLAELQVLGRRRQRRRIATGAVLATGLLALTVVFWRPTEELPLAAVTKVEPVRGVVVIATPHRTLADGTEVDLQEGAVIREEFTPGLRHVVLERGVAHFQVVKNAQRPFVVEAGGVQVRAVGTAFSVQLTPQGAEVVVTEGRVAVSPVPDELLAAVPVSPTLLEAGEGLAAEPTTTAGGGQILKVKPLIGPALAERLSWREPRLEFVGTPLAEVVALMNRHNARQLVLADDSLGALQISGVLRAGNVPAMLELLRENFGIEAEPRGEREILLRRGR